MAAHTGGANAITGVDINGYLLWEAVALAAKNGSIRRNFITKAMPMRLFPDNHFDVTFATTVMEEVNADQMLSELIPVTRPGGRRWRYCAGNGCHWDLTFPFVQNYKPVLRANPTLPKGRPVHRQVSTAGFVNPP
ncbi:MAG: class I SAM-dependent methyltransferase [Caldilineaceae bacterium]